MPSLVNNPIVSTITSAAAHAATNSAGPSGTPAVATPTTPASPLMALLQRVATNASYMTGTGQARDEANYRRQQMQMQQQRQAREDANSDLQTRLQLSQAGAKPVNPDGTVSNPATVFDNNVPAAPGAPMPAQAAGPSSPWNAPDIGAAPIAGASLPSTVASGNVAPDPARVVSAPGGQKYQLPTQADQDARAAQLADSASARRVKEATDTDNAKEANKQKLLDAVRKPIGDDVADELGVPRGSAYSANELSLLMRGKAAKENADTKANAPGPTKLVTDATGTERAVSSDGKAVAVTDENGDPLKVALKAKSGGRPGVGADGLTAVQRLRQQANDKKAEADRADKLANLEETKGTLMNKADATLATERLRIAAMKAPPAQKQTMLDELERQHKQATQQIEDSYEEALKRYGQTVQHVNMSPDAAAPPASAAKPTSPAVAPQADSSGAGRGGGAAPHAKAAPQYKPGDVRSYQGSNYVFNGTAWVRQQVRQQD